MHKATYFDAKEEGSSYSKISRELELCGYLVSRQMISAFVKRSNKKHTDLKHAVTENRCKKKLQMKHFEYTDDQMSKNNELCAIGKNIFLCFVETRELFRQLFSLRSRRYSQAQGGKLEILPAQKLSIFSSAHRAYGSAHTNVFALGNQSERY